MATISYPGKVNAPDFPSGLDWLNTPRPISLRELRGKIVLLDFWTCCCINCMHILPDLKRLERKYRAELVVIGVHSAKFTAERETAAIGSAILRHGIEHPVVNDPELQIWRSYTVRAWPTIMIIDPDGKVIGAHSGEYPEGMLDEMIDALIADCDARGAIDRRPVDFHSMPGIANGLPLAFPGGIAAGADGRTLIVADSGHNRIIIIALDDFRVMEVIGSGEAGLVDGDFGVARFRGPHGIAVAGDSIYVADTENHAIRRIDLRRRSVATILGTGEQARDFTIAGRGRSVALNSPWDLVERDGALYIAMAGSHQIWRADSGTLEAAPFAGSGREALVDGPLQAAALAQPGGITASDDLLYFADSEASAIRSASFDQAGEIRTIVGLGLFEFGDRDGAGDDVRLQHPLGIRHRDGKIYVADSYNHRIKVIDPVTRSARAIIGSGASGCADGAAATAQLNEPGGLAFAGEILFIADTNNHSIRAFDPSTGMISTLAPKFPDRHEKSVEQGPAGNDDIVNTIDDEIIERVPVMIAAGDSALEISLNISEKFILNDEAPPRMRISGDGFVSDFGDEWRTIDHLRFPLRVPLSFVPGDARLLVELLLHYCDRGNGALCFFRQMRAAIPVRVLDSADGRSIPLAFHLD
ncbi:MAG: alkyl hydroperoxide reductase/Thiol specific antioxidant/Mal allergen [Chlorobi bacterium]|nr:alkyl hydroperoxide reductase/Thiol specific antioxidant/Mal allergen [Chlorobiota bacterium]